MPTVPIICRVRALYSFKSNDTSSLQFEQGDCIDVLNKLKSGWWDGWCNGSRGWFPSNYVQIIEEYTDITGVESSSTIEIAKPYQQQNLYEESSRPYTPNSSLPLPRVPRNGVPLQRNQENRLSLPYDHTIDINQQKSEISLPPNWIMELTEDGTDCYYYNKLTGEMQTSPPRPTIITTTTEGIQTSPLPTTTTTTTTVSTPSTLDPYLNNTNSEYATSMNEYNPENDIGDISYNNNDDDNNEEQIKYNLPTSTDQSDGKILNITTQTRDEEISDIYQTLPSQWVKRKNHQGRVYYCNLETQETTWDMNHIDFVTGRLLQTTKTTNHLPIVTSSTIQRDDNDVKRHTNNNNSNNNDNNSNTSSTDITNNRSKLDLNEPLTWNILSTRIAVAISNLNQTGKNGQTSSLPQCSNMVTDSIRLMLLASGTIDKDSNYIRSNTVLRGHHRTMMAAMSKVMLTSFLTADHGSEYVPKLLNENNELLVAVRNFVGTCQDIGVPVQHIDPKLVLDGDSTGYKQASQKKSEQQAKYALQHDLADNLDVYGTNMHESVDAILFNIKAGRQQEDDHFTDNYRFLFGTKMFTQFRNLSSQTGQFLGLVDDIDFVTVEGSPLISDLQQNKQALSDGLGRLFCHLQQVTNQHVPLDNVLLDVEMAAKSIHIPIRNICECINILVYDNDITTRPSLDTIATDTIKHTTISSTTNAYSDGDDGLIDDVHYGDRIGDDDDDDDRTTFMGDSIFSGGNLTYNDTELTDSSMFAPPNFHHNDKPIDASYMSTEKRSSSDSRANATSKPKITTAIMEKTPNAPVTNDPSTASQELEVTKSSHKLKKFFGDDVPSSDIVTTNPTTADRPSYLSYDYDLSDISFNMEGNVKGGTLAALVERLTLHDYLDMNFNNTFLLTYRSFCTSTELLDLLEARYNLVPPSDISDDDMEIWRQKKLKLVRLRVFNVLKNWLEVYYDEEDQIILDRLMKFTDTTIRMTLSFSTDQLERLIQKRKEGTEMDVGGLKKLVWTPQSIPQSILPRNPKKFKLLDLDPTELARQLTIMDFKMYSSIRPIECLDKSWSRETPDDAAPTSVNIRASIEYCNQVTSWVSDAILSQNDIKKRCNLIKFWVQVAEKCRELNNFNTCMAILSAFDNSSVGRLKRTWEMVGARTNQILSQIRKIMGANRNFSEYRQLIHSVNPPCIPFLGIYLQDLTFIEDGNSNIIKKSKDLINFAKREKTAEVIREIQQYQTLFYKLKTVDEVQSFIRANLQSTRDEDQLYKESLKLEPREREDEKITRLLQESGFL